jgi:hypothetical protein
LGGKGVADSPLHSSIAFELSRNSDPAGVGAGGNPKSPNGLYKYNGEQECTALVSLEDRIGSVLSFVGLAVSEPIRPILQSLI